jgi:hypothetical protein
MSDRAKGDAKELRRTVEILGAYVVDMLYNVLHEKVKDDPDIKGAYSSTVTTLQRGLKEDDDASRRLFDALHKNYQIYRPGMTYVELQRHVVRLFVPFAYFRDLKDSEIDEVFADIITGFVSDMCAYVTAPGTIDKVVAQTGINRQSFVKTLQDYAADTLMGHRDRVTNCFTGGTGRPGGVADDVSSRALVVVRKLAEKLKDSEADRHRLATENEKLRKMVKLLNDARTRGPAAAGRAAHAGRAPPPDMLGESRPQPRPMPPPDSLGETHVPRRPVPPVDRLGEGEVKAPSRRVDASFFDDDEPLAVPARPKSRPDAIGKRASAKRPSKSDAAPAKNTEPAPAASATVDDAVEPSDSADIAVTEADLDWGEPVVQDL